MTDQDDIHDHIEVRGVRENDGCDASLTGRHLRARVSARASASPR